MKNSIILDSGAFSAWTKGISIDIDEYISFIKKYEKHIDIIINLDVIPGNKDTKIISKIDINDAAKKGFDNYYYMIKNGIPKEKLMHVFHQGEDPIWLLKMIDEMDYVGISPNKNKTTEQKINWLDTIYSKYICDEKGMPKVKTHGFGETSNKIIMRYPWYSVDSTSWVLTSRFGGIFIPHFKNGVPNYNKSPLKITFSNRPSKPDKYNYNNGITPILKKYVDTYLYNNNLKIGKSSFDKNGIETIIEPGLINDYKERDKANIIYFLNLEKSFPKWPWPFKLNNRVNRFSL